MSTSGPKPPRPGTAAAYHHGGLREALLAAAAALLARKGPAGLSLREAAREAGVSHNAPYRHFADREALLAALAAQGFTQLTAAMRAAAEAAPPGGRLRAAGRAYLRFAAAERARYLLMFGPEIRLSAHPALAEAAGAAMATLRGAAAADASAAGAASRRARHAAVGAWALVHGLAHLIADGRIAGDLGEDGHAALIEDVLATYGAGLASRDLDHAHQGRQAR